MADRGMRSRGRSGGGSRSWGKGAAMFLGYTRIHRRSALASIPMGIYYIRVSDHNTLCHFWRREGSWEEVRRSTPYFLMFGLPAWIFAFVSSYVWNLGGFRTTVNALFGFIHYVFVPHPAADALRERGTVDAPRPIKREELRKYSIAMARPGGRRISCCATKNARRPFTPRA